MSSQIDTFSVAKDLSSVQLDRLPNLIIDECLQDCAKEISATADMILLGDFHLPYETLAMPKKKFEPRPVTVASTPARVAYAALVNSVSDSLGPKSREDGNLAIHKSFTVRNESNYFVDFDIASFYEYIDHGILAQQLLTRTLNSEVVEKFMRILKSLTKGARGLPQLLSASDHLSDSYISALERRLVRNGYSVVRYADDFTVACPDWEAANVIIERAAEYARDLGLVLSSEKTNIRKRATIIATEESEARFINRYSETAENKLVTRIFTTGRYGEFIEELETFSEKEAAEGTMWSLVRDWYEVMERAAPEDSFRVEGHFRTFLGVAVDRLRGHDERIPDSILEEIVFKHPLFLDSVCEYVATRAHTHESREDPWESMRILSNMGRQSPWAKIWMLDTIARTHTRKMDSCNYSPVMNWVDAQVEDRHEVVRAQAAWAASCHGRLSESALTGAYTHASPLSQHALAACMGKQGGMGNGIVQAIRQDGPLNRKAFEWAQGV
ncbi:reverse transcriptase domain-containing protein [Streptomyces sp. NBC_01465]|uniref:reverse transcriptase domain-containing protein n=1 Tax=Streptomyces sp. NBC_01465 TaxID=2903878 RepID=UPI002E2FD426|nr:reverse transcriptase domain-containing protein [Streptomyces sp. NBC_01465]